MTMDKKTTKTEIGTFKYQRYDIVKDFFCDRCDKDKKAKIIVTWIDLENNNKTICNGCYGLLLSKINK